MSHVDLEDIDRHILEHVKGGVAAAEVVHLYYESGLAEFLHYADHLVGIAHHDGLGDLDPELSWIDAVIPDKSIDIRRNVHEVEVLRGDVYGYEEVPALLLPAREDLACALPHILIDLGYHAVLLKAGNEPVGSEEAVLLVDPAYECLCSDDVAVPVRDRLQIRPYVACLDGIEELCGYLLVPQDLLPDLLIVVGDMLCIFVAQSREREACTCEHLGGVGCVISNFVDADLDRDREVGLLVLHRKVRKHLFDSLCREAVLRDQDTEIIACEPAVDALIGELVLEISCHVLQDLIAEFRTEDIVYDLEVLDVQEQYQIIGKRTGREDVGDHLEKIFLRIKSRQPVVCRLVHLAL